MRRSSRVRAALVASLLAAALASCPGAPAVGAEPACTVTGTAGDDDLVGTSGDDVICGLGGDDVVRAGSGDDLVVMADGQGMTAFLEEGDDTFDGSLGAFATVDGGPGSDTITGTPGDDVLDGGAGPYDDEDVIDAGGGDDVVNGSGAGTVVAELGDGDDEYDGAEGGGADVDAGDGADVLTGTPGDDDLDGGPGVDQLFGVGGNDDLAAGPGDDVLVGGPGVDQGDGGEGLDFCDRDDGEAPPTRCRYDDDAPVMGIEVTPDTVEVGVDDALVRLDLHAEDLIGIDGLRATCQTAGARPSIAWVQVSMRGGRLQVDGAQLVSRTGDATDLDVAVDVTVRRGTYPGDYVCQVGGTDLVGNSTNGPRTGLTVTRAGTGFDDDGPVVTGLTIGPSTVDVSGGDVPVDISYEVAAASGVFDTRAYCERSYRDSAGNPQYVAPIHGGVAWLEPSSEPYVYGGGADVAGADEHRVVELRLAARQGSPPGDYPCTIRSIDRIGNESIARFTLTVVRTGTTYDDDGPVVTAISRSPSRVDVGSEGQEVVFDLRATDVSGVAHVSMSCLVNGHQPVSGQLVLRPDTSVERVQGLRVVAVEGTTQDLHLVLAVRFPRGTAPEHYACHTGLGDARGLGVSAEFFYVGVERTPPGQPTRPGGLSFVQDGPTSGILSWDAPGFLGDPALTAYEIKANGIFYGRTATAATSARVTGLVQGQMTDLQVRGYNGGEGEYGGQWSFPLTVMHVSPVPATAPTGLAAGDVGTTSASFSWERTTDTGGAVESDVLLELSRDGGATWVAVPHAPTTSTSLSASGLRGGTDYLARVASVTFVGPGAFSTPVAFSTMSVPPSAPVGLSVGLTGPRQVRLSWESPAELGGQPVLGYLVEASRPGSAWVTVPGSTSSRSLTVDNLTRGVDFRFRVSAWTAGGTGAASDEVTVKAPLTLPGRPLGVRVKDGSVGVSRATVQWLRPTDNGGASILSYRWEVSADGGRTWVVVRHPASPVRAMRLSGLEPGSRYAVRVRTQTEVGLSLPSARVVFTTTERHGR